MADRVHRAVQAVELPVAHAAADRAAPEAERDELIERHHAVLGGGERGERAVLVASGALRTHVVR